MKKLQFSKYISPVFITPENTGSWFGYYNYDTLNSDQTKLLCSRTEHDAELPQKGYLIEVGYYDIPSGEWHKIGISDSYSWPQGCMAQWIPGKGKESKIIYNTSDGVKNISIIYDINTKKEKKIDWSIYGITPDGKKSIALIMERSHWCRAYHYESIADTKYEGNVYVEDGIYEIDLDNNSRRKLISIQQIIAIDNEDYFDDAKHWIEHIMISPNGKRFCFLHRFTIGGLNDYETRLFVSDIDGSNIQCIEGWKEYYWSHFGWNGDNAFTIYSYESNVHSKVIDRYYKAHNEKCNKEKENMRLRSSIKKNLRPLYYTIPNFLRKRIGITLKGPKSYYQYYKLENGCFKLDVCFKNIEFSTDGHPSFTQDGIYMITDTYPHSNKYQDLMVYNLVTKKVIKIGSLFAALWGKPGSCDLHPKLCKNNKYIAVDSAHNGKHHVILFKIDWSKIKEKIG